MCDPVSLIVGTIATAVGVGSSVYSSSKQKKAQAAQTKATQALINAQSNAGKTSVAKTASSATVNDTTNKRTISSLRTGGTSLSSVNTGSTSMGLNIPT